MFNDVDWSNPELYWVTIILCTISYLVGSFSFSRLASWFYSKFRGKPSLGETGSGNYGATNVGRIYGKLAFFLVYLAEIVKVMVLGGLFDLVLNSVDVEGSITIGLFFAIVGSAFPIYYKFKGGKLVSAVSGFLLITNWLAFVIALTIFLIIIFLTKWVSLSSLVGMAIGCIMATTGPLWMNEVWFLSFAFDAGIVFTMWASFILSILRHRENIKNLFNNSERTVNFIPENEKMEND